MTDQFPHIRVVGTCRKLGPTIEFQREGEKPIIYQPGPDVFLNDAAANAATRFGALDHIETLEMRENILRKLIEWLVARLDQEQKQAEAAR